MSNYSAEQQQWVDAAYEAAKTLKAQGLKASRVVTVSSHNRRWTELRDGNYRITVDVDKCEIKIHRLSKDGKRLDASKWLPLFQDAGFSIEKQQHRYSSYNILAKRKAN